jgi:1-aminocyclopropane-1-carboxylate deaminase/D-cysteine desulfhydrase-like pyridoxal-dependent ACC family enzyme
LRGQRPETESGNLLLDRLFGAELMWAGDVSLQAPLDEAAGDAEADGRRPYVIPFGGSNAIGSVAYAMAVKELMEQNIEVDRIVVATSSGGTLAGLLAGAQLFGFKGRITAIRIDKFKGSQMVRLSEHAAATAKLLGREIEVPPVSIDVREGYLESGYGVLTDLERNAIETFARLEGILLDPVYTGRTAGGMLDLIKSGEIGSDERVLFWHTGGTPALFAYEEQLLR